MVNSDLIESIESAADTILVLTSGKRWPVEESPEEVIRRIVEFRRQIYTLPAVGERT